MPKRFDCEDAPNEFMEMPCMCDCGKWFDLNDGHANRDHTKTICRECKEEEDSSDNDLQDKQDPWPDEEDIINDIEEDEFIPCDKCDGHDACEDFGCAFELGLGHLVNKDLSNDWDL